MGSLNSQQLGFTGPGDSGCCGRAWYIYQQGKHVGSFHTFAVAPKGSMLHNQRLL